MEREIRIYLKRNYIMVEAINYTEKEQNCVTRSQVKEEFHRHVEEHCESPIVKSVEKKGTAVFVRTKAVLLVKETDIKGKLYHSRRSKLYSKEQDCATRSQVREEFHRHVEEHYESLIVKSVKAGSTIVVFGREK